MCAGVQPVPGPTLCESSSAERKPWLTNGLPSPSRSHARALRPETPEAILAMISDSRSAIAFPDERVGLNLGLRPLGPGADRPAVDRPCLSGSPNPGPAECRIFDEEEIRLGN